MQQDEVGIPTESSRGIQPEIPGANGKWAAGRADKQDEFDENYAQHSFAKARRVYDDARLKASEYLTPAGEYLSSLNTSATQTIRQYPVQAAVGGLLIGFCLGALLSRRMTASPRVQGQPS